MQALLKFIILSREALTKDILIGRSKVKLYVSKCCIFDQKNAMKLVL